jgi:hypothetical protein
VRGADQWRFCCGVTWAQAEAYATGKNASGDETSNCDCAAFWLGAQAGMPVLLNGNGKDRTMGWLVRLGCCRLVGGRRLCRLRRGSSIR